MTSCVGNKLENPDQVMRLAPLAKVLIQSDSLDLVPIHGKTACVMPINYISGHGHQHHILVFCKTLSVISTEATSRKGKCSVKGMRANAMKGKCSEQKGNLMQVDLKCARPGKHKTHK